MNLKTKLLFAAAVILLSGCAEVVKKTYGPAKAGTVRYSTAWFMAEKNRAKAVEEMRSYCAPGRAQLMGEDSRAEFTGQSHSNSETNGSNVYTSSNQAKEKFIYLHFKCEQRKLVKK